jgi:hypothetical protein
LSLNTFKLGIAKYTHSCSLCAQQLYEASVAAPNCYHTLSTLAGSTYMPGALESHAKCDLQ